MITTQRVILYRIDDDDKFEIVNSYDFNTSMTVVPIGLFRIFVFLKFCFYFFY